MKLKQIKLDVKDHHIKNGICGNSAKCAGALAIAEYFGLSEKEAKDAYIRVNERGVAFNFDGMRYWFVLPTKYKRAAKEWDVTGEMKPGKWVLTQVDEKPVTKPRTREQKDWINTLRNERHAVERAEGVPLKTYRRFV